MQFSVENAFKCHGSLRGAGNRIDTAVVSLTDEAHDGVARHIGRGHGVCQVDAQCEGVVAASVDKEVDIPFERLDLVVDALLQDERTRQLADIQS